MAGKKGAPYGNKNAKGNGSRVSLPKGVNRLVQYQVGSKTHTGYGVNTGGFTALYDRAGKAGLPKNTKSFKEFEVRPGPPPKKRK